MTFLGDLKLRCFSILELLKRLGQRLAKCSRKKNRTMSIGDMTGKRGEEEALLNTRRCLSGGTPVLGLIPRRAISCPSMWEVYDQAGTDGGGIVPGGVLDPMSATILKTSRSRKTSTIGNVTKISNLEDGAGARRSEEEAVISKCPNVKRKISNALTIGITGAKIASLFFTISSLIYSTSSEADVLDEDIDDA